MSCHRASAIHVIVEFFNHHADDVVHIRHRCQSQDPEHGKPSYMTQFPVTEAQSLKASETAVITDWRARLVYTIRASIPGAEKEKRAGDIRSGHSLAMLSCVESLATC